MLLNFSYILPSYCHSLYRFNVNNPINLSNEFSHHFNTRSPLSIINRHARFEKFNCRYLFQSSKPQKIDEGYNEDDIPMKSILKPPKSPLAFQDNELKKVEYNRKKHVEEILNILDLSSPHEWYEVARKMKRKFILHIGPTNSGKTHHAMERLISSESGIYCAPLRLLAEQNFEKINQRGVPCDLITGERVIKINELDEDTRSKILKSSDDEFADAIIKAYKDSEDEFEEILRDNDLDGNINKNYSNNTSNNLINYKNSSANNTNNNSEVPLNSENFELKKNFNRSNSSTDANHISCTIEMLRLEKIVSVVVIDEYQLFTDEARGWAWTRAILGAPAEEVHLCGDLSSVDLVRQILKSTNDEIIIHDYKRLSELRLSPMLNPNKWIYQLNPGDAIIAFSRIKMFKIRNEIEKKLGPCTCIVYGSLPSQSRSKQAREFNNGQDRHILVASDAIGLGLNLNIRKIIFAEVKKFDGVQTRYLYPQEIRQIAGRAGRYGSRFPVGYFCGIGSEAQNYLLSNYNKPAIIKKKAGLIPLIEKIEALDSVLRNALETVEKNSLSELLKIFEDYATTSKIYFMCNYEQTQSIAAMIDHLSLSLPEKYTFCCTPIRSTSQASELLKKFATNFANGVPSKLPSLEELKKCFPEHEFGALHSWENICNLVDSYLWLSYRFGGFDDFNEALNLTMICEENISMLLSTPPTSKTIKNRQKFLKSSKNKFSRKQFNNYVNNNTNTNTSSSIRQRTLKK